jgi:nitrogen fixation NifU-like protein
MPYSDKILEHYNNPRNVGSFDAKDETVGTGLVGAPECGDVLKLSIKVNPDTGVIEDARFKTFGCGSVLAEDAIKAAINNYQEKQIVESEKREPAAV